MKEKIKNIILEAGKILKTNYFRQKSVETKSSYRDVVTEIDSEIELFLKTKFKKLLPNSEFLAEETDSNLKSAKYLWIIDPIDGTVNFIHKFPFTCISVALYVDGEAKYGFVYNPIINEFFEAEKDCGSFLNDKKIHVSTEEDISKTICATGFPYAFSNDENLIFGFLKNMKQKIRGIRRAGSAALDLCYLAKGVFSGFWEWHLKPWDVAAGKLIIEEAGGIVTNINGEKYSFEDESFVATNKKINIIGEFKEFKSTYKEGKQCNQEK